MTHRYALHAVSAALLAAGLVACSQGPDAEAPDTSEQSLTEGSGTPRQGRQPGAGPEGRHRMGHHGDPAKMIERLDADNNGTVELAELPPHMRERLAKADADGDLRLTADELNAHHEQMKKQHFAAKDTNQDGALSADEVGKRWTHMSVADADKDGRITQAELDAAHAEGKLRPHGKAGGRHKLDPEAFLKRFDANANGTLELGELPEHKREKLGAADANKDQQITAEELKMFFEQRRMQRGAPTGAAPAAEPSTR